VKSLAAFSKPNKVNFWPSPLMQQSPSVYKLGTPTIGVRNDNGKRVTITLPTNALLEVTMENVAEGTVDVIWNDQNISMFAIDLQERGRVVKHGPRKMRTSE
jgi:hypothetical protein